MDIIGIGKPYYDMVINVKKLPKLEGGTGAEAVFHQGGGKVATAMVTAARLGQKTGIIARVGNSESGRFILNDFKMNGVDTSAVVIDEPGTTSPFCLSLSEQESRKRMFIGKAGTATELQSEDIDYEYLRKAKYLEVESGQEYILEKVLPFAKANGIMTVMDADGYNDNIPKIISYIDYFIASEFCYQAMVGDTGYEDGMSQIKSLGPKVVIVTLGSEGCVGMDEKGNYFKLDSFKVNAIDTTGAGDVFHGAFIAGLLEDKTVKESAIFASAAAAIKCMYPGGRTGIPRSDMVDSFIKTGEFNQDELKERLEYYLNN
jgi:sugar/nucleoside kinase (ribokinase family)